MISHRLGLLAIALAAAACGTQQAGQQRTAASASPQVVGVCTELACPWLRLPGACDLAAADIGAPPGPYLEVQILDPAVGTTTATSGGSAFSLTLDESLLSADWSATTGVSFVIASGLLGGAAYLYVPPATGDAALRTYLDRPITGATFCYGAAPDTLAGCTLTQGYWKTHGREGPAPYDARWQDLGPLGEATPFFLSGKSWYEVFRTPVEGSPYLSLAHQYMAAKLNVLAGASAGALGDALANSEAFFAASTPATPLTAAQRAELLSLATLLDGFNSGRIGPGHCGDRGDDSASEDGGI